MAFVNPLELDKILLGWFAGGVSGDAVANGVMIFILVAFLFIAIIGARMRMPNIVLGGMLISFVVIFSVSSGIYGQGSALQSLLVGAFAIISILLANAFRKFTEGN